MSNQNDFESNEQEQYYLEQYKKQLEEQELLESEYYYISYLEDECKNKHQRIAELEKENEELKQKLENAIVPKFIIGQKVWYLFSKKQDKPYSLVIKGYEINTRKKIIRYQTDIFTLDEDNYWLFDNFEDAYKKLNEMKGE